MHNAHCTSSQLCAGVFAFECGSQLFAQWSSYMHRCTLIKYAYLYLYSGRLYQTWPLVDAPPHSSSRLSTVASATQAAQAARFAPPTYIIQMSSMCPPMCWLPRCVTLFYNVAPLASLGLKVGGGVTFVQQLRFLTSYCESNLLKCSIEKPAC